MYHSFKATRTGVIFEIGINNMAKPYNVKF